MYDESHRAESLAPDLDWILTSTQVTDTQVTNFLISQYLPRLYIFAIFLGEKPERAWELSLYCVENAIHQRERFTGDCRAEIWLYSLLVSLNSQQSQIKFSKPISTLTAPDIGFDFKMVIDSLKDLPVSDRLRIFLTELCRLGSEEYQALLENCENFEPREHRKLVRVKPSQRTKWSEDDVQEKIDSWQWSGLLPDRLDEIADALTSRLTILQRKRKRWVGVLQAGFLSIALLFMLLMGNVLPFDKIQGNQKNEVVITLVTTRLVRVMATPQPSLTPNHVPENATLLRAVEGETLRQLAQRAWTELELLVEYNRLDPGAVLREGQPIIVGLDGPPLSELEPTPVPLRNADPVIGKDSQINDVIWHLSNTSKHWDTLHLDGFIYTYAQPGFITPPKITHSQVWTRGRQYSLLLEGDRTGKVNTAWRKEGSRLFIVDHITGRRSIIQGGDVDRADLSQLVYPMDSIATYQTFSSDHPLSRILAYKERNSFRIVGSDRIAGREVLIVEWFTLRNGSYSYKALQNIFGNHSYLQRWWVDTRTGVILRRQVFWDTNGEHLQQEIIVTNAVFDINLPNRLFDHFQPAPEHFQDEFLPQEFVLSGMDSGGEDGSLTKGPSTLRRAPPKSFDPAAGDLSFEWMNLAEPGNQFTLPTAIFSNGYYLGTMKMGDPLTMVCRRSPDGSKLAFSNGSRRFGYPGQPLRWFDLRSFTPAQTILPEIYPYEWAFSSSGRFLAVHGCTFNYKCRIYLVDLEAGTTAPLVYFDEVASLTWLADDENIVLMGSQYRGESWTEYLVHVKTAQITQDVSLLSIRQKLPFEVLFPRPVDAWGWILYQPCSSFSEKDTVSKVDN